MPISFKPGQAVPRPGNYVVYHQHRIGHPARVDSKVFPWCKRCGENARFELISVSTVSPVQSIFEDEDFRLGLSLVSSESCA